MVCTEYTIKKLSKISRDIHMLCFVEDVVQPHVPYGYLSIAFAGYSL